MCLSQASLIQMRNQGQSVVSSVRKRISPFSQKRLHLQCHFFQDLVSHFTLRLIQTIDSTKQSVQLARYLPGLRLQLTFRVKVSLYIIKSLLVKRLIVKKQQRQIHNRLIAYKNCYKMCVSLSIHERAHLQIKLYSSPNHTSRKTDNIVACTACNY